ncbi:MAG: class I SAM-dependent methyltransferase, partial [Candidatus Bathyarchaeia archaeon]
KDEDYFMISVNHGVRVISRPTCALCGLPGQVFYTGMYDRLFTAPGIWDIRICWNCELAWLDPCPSPEEVGKLYLDYFTHQIMKPPDSYIVQLKQGAKRAVWAAWLGYRQGIGRKLLLAGYFARLFPPLYEAAMMAVMGLSAEKRGRLIDIGCGNGQFLALMRDLGWEVLGVEPDVEAARVAEDTFGIKVIPSTLEEASLPDASADVITMNHVIEHVHDPITLLKECRRVLRPGGMLVVVTPNLNSFGRRLWGKAWLHWDPPRHYFIFSAKSLLDCARRTGLQVKACQIIARGARLVWAISQVIQANGRCFNVRWEEFPWGTRLAGWVFQWLEHLFGGGEELFMVATK